MTIGIRNIDTNIIVGIQTSATTFVLTILMSRRNYNSIDKNTKLFGQKLLD